ncbi:hypothetical protein [Paraburkholderia flava]|uniref:hypothetical protein n=1 Tax=Paraburkholderia flava TaxID=2547393 RepID=UPI00105F36E5|nr:hypothetical protein [Paraburkholderia flava]
MSTSPASWEPYCHRPEAEFHLSSFAGRVLGPQAGVIFFDGIGASRLKTAMPDAKGRAVDLVVAVSRPPFMPADRPSSANTQSIDQLARSRAGGAPPGGPGLSQTFSKARDFIERHKTGFDTAAVAGDTIGVVTGAICVVALIAGGIAVLPVLGAIAGAASLVLLAEDGSMLHYELKGDEVRKKQLESSWHYKLAETVGPILVLPDLVASGPRTFASLPKAAREVGDLSQEAAQAANRLSAQRTAMEALSKASQDNPNRVQVLGQVQQMQEQASGFAKNVREAQEKLMAARRELLMLRTIEAPGYIATIYGTGVYGIDPPEAIRHGVDWMQQHLGSNSRQDPEHPAHLLAPNRPLTPLPGAPAPIVQLRVGVSHNPGAAH